LQKGVKGLQDAVRKFKVTEEELKKPEIADKALSPEIIAKCETIEGICVTRMNNNVNKRLVEIEGNISQTDFKEAASYLEMLEDIVQFCDTNLSKANREKYDELKAGFKKKIEAIIDEYGKRAIKDYLRHPLKSLVANLTEAKLQKHIGSVCDSVRRTILSKIEELTDKGANL